MPYYFIYVLIFNKILKINKIIALTNEMLQCLNDYQQKKHVKQEESNDLLILLSIILCTAGKIAIKNMLKTEQSRAKLKKGRKGEENESVEIP